MNYWELAPAAVALVIASLLLAAIAISVLRGWAPEDDSENEALTERHGQRAAGRER